VKIIRQLAEWMLQSGRLSPEEFNTVRHRILGEPLSDVEIERAREAQETRDSLEDSEVSWWNLHGAGIRAGLKERSPQKKGRRKVPNATPIRVWDLEPRLPVLLMGSGTGFKLPQLLWEIAMASGRDFQKDWTGFVNCAAYLYGLDAEKLHDSLRLAIITDPKDISATLLSMERGDPLFPLGFLKDYSGQSVGNIWKRIRGDDNEFAYGNRNWILKYPNFNTLNEACIVRNRIRRIFRLWVVEGAELVENIRDADHPHGGAGIQLNFGKVRMNLPLDILQKLYSSGNGAIAGGELVRTVTNSCGNVFLPVKVDDVEYKAMLDGWIDVFAEEEREYRAAMARCKLISVRARKEREGQINSIEQFYANMRKQFSGVKRVSLGNLRADVLYDGSTWGMDLSSAIGFLCDQSTGTAFVWNRKKNAKGKPI